MENQTAYERYNARSRGNGYLPAGFDSPNQLRGKLPINRAQSKLFRVARFRMIDLTGSRAGY